MNIKEKINRAMVGNTKLPKLHGHTKIILRDAKTGEITDVVEKDNLVTDAIENIYSNNYFGALNLPDITPLRDMLGGVLCFEDPMMELASNVLPPSEDENKMIANAGQTAHSSASTTRGNPNGTLSEEIQNGKGYKFVWDFSTSAANGTINTVCLVNKVGGDVGLKPIEQVANSPLMAISSNKATALYSGVAHNYSEFYHALVKIDTANETGLYVELAERPTSTLTVKEISLCLSTQGVNDPAGRAIVTDTHSVTLTRSFDRRYTAICCDDDYMYVVEPSANEGTTLYIDKIDLSTWTATSMDITDASLSLRNEMFFRNYDYGYACRTCISDGYLYWYKSDKRSFYKFNLSNTADIVEIDTEMTEDCNEEYGMVAIGNGIVVGKNFFINDKVYPMATEPANKIMYYTDYTTPFIRFVRDGSNFYVWAYLYDTSYSTTVYAACAFPRLMLSTIQVLNNPVVKTSDKTMQIQYSITLDES